MALLQVTLLVTGLDQTVPEAPSSLGGAVGVSLDRVAGSWTPDRSWDLPTAVGAVGQGCGARHAWQLVRTSWP